MPTGSPCGWYFWSGFVAALLMGFGAQRAVRTWRVMVSPTRHQLACTPTPRTPLQVFLNSLRGCVMLFIWMGVALAGLIIVLFYL